MDDGRETLIGEMLAALKNGDTVLAASDGRTYSHKEMQGRLVEWIPTSIEAKRVCELSSAVVVAAPHVSFDNWAEYFANRLAHDLRCGEVLAKNFRDEDGGKIPVSIGRHIHVNRPSESSKRGGRERETDRALRVFEEYRAALFAAGQNSPLDLLIEIHGHRRHLKLEVATAGVDEHTARELMQTYLGLTSDDSRQPQIAIEPIDRLKFSAKRAKEHGSLHPSVCKAALHIEIPRVCRENEEARGRFRPVLSSWLKSCIKLLTART
ncbi:MAG: hypothetical protein KDB65_05845 [Calditrichaeota bacterium]|nr:hypothetical protein [Calditrichota bacterium]MCB9367742.1 hypothetical protein [Calditrichota bacterium]